MIVLRNFIIAIIVLVIALAFTLFMVKSNTVTRGSLTDNLGTLGEYSSTLPRADINQWSSRRIYGANLDNFIRTYSCRDCYIFFKNKNKSMYYLKPSSADPLEVYKMSKEELLPKLTGGVYIVSSSSVFGDKKLYSECFTNTYFIGTRVYTVNDVWADSDKTQFIGFYIQED